MNATPRTDDERSESFLAPVSGRLYLHQGGALLLYKRQVDLPHHPRMYAFHKLALRAEIRLRTIDRYLYEDDIKTLTEVKIDELPTFVSWAWKSPAFDALLSGALKTDDLRWLFKDASPWEKP